MPAASGEKLVIGTLANWVGLPAWYAYKEGYYEEVGLDVEIVNFGSQGTLVNEAMAGVSSGVFVSSLLLPHALTDITITAASKIASIFFAFPYIIFTSSFLLNVFFYF